MRALVWALALAACGGNAPSHLPDYPATDTEAFNVFARACSACHRPPQPQMHRAHEWPQVVARMEQHRAERGLAPLPRQERALILEYLQRYAADGGGG